MKTLRTKTRRYVVNMGSEQFSVPSSVYRKLRKELEPHRVRDESVLTFDQFFGPLSKNLPEWACNLRGLRYRENLSQVEFAKGIGISQSNLSAMENGKRSIGKQIANRIATRFNIDYRYFL